MSDYALDHFADRTDLDHDSEIVTEERDWTEILVRTTSRLAGYVSLAAAVIGIVYLAIR